jgi:Cu/Ag efflux pump CusA
MHFCISLVQLLLHEAFVLVLFFLLFLFLDMRTDILSYLVLGICSMVASGRVMRPACGRWERLKSLGKGLIGLGIIHG